MKRVLGVILPFVLLLAAFLGGYLLGGFSDERFHPHMITAEQRQAYRERKLEMLRYELELGEEQVKAIRSVLQAQGEKLQALRREIRPQFRKIKQNMVKEIRAQLSDEQQIRFDEIEKRIFYKGRRWQRNNEKQNGSHNGSDDAN